MPTAVLALGLIASCAEVAGAPGGPPATSPGSVRPERHYGINVEPSYRPWRWAKGPNPDSWWDPTTGQGKADAEMRMAAQLGVTFLRIELPWTFLQPQRDAFDWGRSDYIVDVANHYGVQLQPVVVFCPRWSGAPSCVPRPADYGSFVTALVSRYHNSIHYWEMWNESSDRKYFGGNQQQYVSNVLNPGYDAVKSVDPHAQVIVSGQYTTTQGWVDGLYAAGARFDVAAYHDYATSAAAVNHDAAAIQSWFGHHGFTGPLWLAEFGMQEKAMDDTAQQAYFSGVIESGNPATTIMWYSLRDDVIYSGPTTADHTEHFGLASHGLAEKTGWCAYHRLVASTPCGPHH